MYSCHCMKISYQFVLCVSEPFTLLHTRNLKRCSMDCSSQIVEQCTCPRPGLQVSTLHGNSLSHACDNHDMNGELLYQLVPSKIVSLKS